MSRDLGWEVLGSENQENSRRLELSISKKSRTEGVVKVQAVSTQVPGRLAFPGARNPRMCSISRFGKIYPGIFPQLSLRTPEQIPETATAFLSFLRKTLCKKTLGCFFIP